MRARTLALGSILVAVGALVVLAFFMDRDDRSRNDALLLLDRYEGIDVDDPVEERRTRIEALAAIPLGDGTADRVRDACVEAHRLLIRAEDTSATARGLFAQATRGGGAEDDIPTAVRADIESALSESNDALTEARDRMPRCLSEMRTLEVRFRPHHLRAD